MRSAQFFAVIPAAGRSRRMGEHKLLLPWQNARVIDHVLQAWTASQVLQTVVVVRSDDLELQKACCNWPVTLYLLESDTPDMKASVQQGLSFAEKTLQPAGNYFCLIAPADLPRLKAELIDGVIEASTDSNRITAPYFGKKRGHPVSFPWNITKAIFDLAEDEGLNSLIDRCDIKRLQMDARHRLYDLDTPADYLRERDIR